MELLSFGHVSNEFFTSYSPFSFVILQFILFIILFCNTFHFGLGKQNWEFRLSSSCCLFISKFFNLGKIDIGICTYYHYDFCCMFIHKITLLCKIFTMPCDIQVWGEISPNGISKLSFLVEVHNLYIYKATLGCHVLKEFRVYFEKKSSGHSINICG